MSNQTTKTQRTMRDFFTSPSEDATRLMASARLSDSRESLSDKSESPSTEMMKVLFREKETSEFWISIYEQYPQLAQKAVEILLPFGSSYLCELGFSALTQIKTKTRSRMVDIDKEMRVALSKVQPRLELICSERQAHPSH